MIGRIWHGWTTLENADSYEQLLKSEIFKGIAAKDVPGYRGITLLKRQTGAEMEFITFMLFDSLEAVRQFAGEEYEQAYVPVAARKILKRFDERSQHYEVREQIVYE